MGSGSYKEISHERDEILKHPKEKKKGPAPIYNHEKIIELLKAGETPLKIMLLLGCSYSVIRYVRKKMKEKKEYDKTHFQLK